MWRFFTWLRIKWNSCWIAPRVDRWWKRFCFSEPNWVRPFGPGSAGRRATFKANPFRSFWELGDSVELFPVANRNRHLPCLNFPVPPLNKRNWYQNFLVEIKLNWIYRIFFQKGWKDEEFFQGFSQHEVIISESIIDDLADVIQEFRRSFHLNF